MRNARTLVATIAVALAAPGWTATARAVTPQPTGPHCTLAAADDPAGQPGEAVGTVTGGPLVADPTTTLVCTVQVGGAGVHADPDAAVVFGTLYVPPTQVAFSGSGSVYLCTAARVAGEDVYWDEALASWTTDPTTAQCAFQFEIVNPVVGGIAIELTTAASPVVTLSGALADPLLWQCQVPAYDPTVPFSVTCLPRVSVTLQWRCAVLHADVITASPSALARTSMDCDGDAVPEAQTFVVSGTGGVDGQSAGADISVSAFVCTVDDGAGHAGVPDLHAFCGDPGVPTIAR